MLVVRVELHSANDGSITEIGRAHICNVTEKAMAHDTHADYRIDTLRGRDKQSLDRGVKTHTGTVRNYPRQKFHVWNLVVRALASCGYGAPERLEHDPLSR